MHHHLLGHYPHKYFFHLFMLRIWHCMIIFLPVVTTDNPQFVHKVCKQQKKVLFLIAIIFIFSLYSMVVGFVYASKVTMFNLSYDISKEAIIPESYETDKDAVCIADQTKIIPQSSRLAGYITNYVCNKYWIANKGSLVAGACFITYLIWPHNFVFMGIFFVLGTAYYNSLLASLNARPALREKLNADLLILSPEVSERFVARAAIRQVELSTQ
ncbi:hypothetical protein BDQ17DRAFT_1411527 [Cyathus striatus]|nr:hypothetical protein BDQ17DRAFT_1411527 [Cyathus striatus]